MVLLMDPILFKSGLPPGVQRGLAYIEMASKSAPREVRQRKQTILKHAFRDGLRRDFGGPGFPREFEDGQKNSESFKETFNKK